MKLPDLNDIAITVIPGRMPQMKVHLSRTEAKKALLYKTYRNYDKGYVEMWSRDMEMYVPLAGEWTLFAKVKRDTPVDSIDWVSKT